MMRYIRYPPTIASRPEHRWRQLDDLQQRGLCTVITVSTGIFRILAKVLYLHWEFPERWQCSAGSPSAKNRDTSLMSVSKEL
jgi:hypothetical protein